MDAGTLAPDDQLLKPSGGRDPPSGVPSPRCHAAKIEPHGSYPWMEVTDGCCVATVSIHIMKMFMDALFLTLKCGDCVEIWENDHEMAYGWPMHVETIYMNVDGILVRFQEPEFEEDRREITTRAHTDGLNRHLSILKCIQQDRKYSRKGGKASEAMTFSKRVMRRAERRAAKAETRI